MTEVPPQVPRKIPFGSLLGDPEANKELYSASYIISWRSALFFAFAIVAIMVFLYFLDLLA